MLSEVSEDYFNFKKRFLSRHMPSNENGIREL
jgi:hypothetical protein